MDSLIITCPSLVSTVLNVVELIRITMFFYFIVLFIFLFLFSYFALIITCKEHIVCELCLVLLRILLSILKFPSVRTLFLLYILCGQKKHRLITAHMHESTSSHRQTWPDSIIVIMMICNDW